MEYEKRKDYTLRVKEFSENLATLFTQGNLDPLCEVEVVEAFEGLLNILKLRRIGCTLRYSLSTPFEKFTRVGHSENQIEVFSVMNEGNNLLGKIVFTRVLDAYCMEIKKLLSDNDVTDTLDTLCYSIAYELQFGNYPCEGKVTLNVLGEDIKFKWKIERNEIGLPPSIDISYRYVIKNN